MAEYVLPKFDVAIDSPKDFSMKDGKMKAIIRSRYTYGEMVKGEAIVSWTQKYVWSSSKLDTVIKTIPVDGKGIVEFDFERDLKLDMTNQNNILRFDLEATVIEGLTGRNQSTTKEITLYPTRYQFDHEAASQFIQGSPITIWVSFFFVWCGEILI